MATVYFLDVYISISNGEYVTSVYHKLTCSLIFTLPVPRTRGSIRWQHSVPCLGESHTYCSNQGSRYKEIGTILKQGIQNGYGLKFLLGIYTIVKQSVQ